MKKYLTIEEIRNSEKLKQMDHKTSLVGDTEEKTSYKIRKWIMLAVDVLAVVMIVEEAKEKLKKINVRDCCLWWSLIIYDQKHSTHPTFFNPQFML